MKDGGKITLWNIFFYFYKKIRLLNYFHNWLLSYFHKWSWSSPSDPTKFSITMLFSLSNSNSDVDFKNYEFNPISCALLFVTFNLCSLITKFYNRFLLPIIFVTSATYFLMYLSARIHTPILCFIFSYTSKFIYY